MQACHGWTSIGLDINSSGSGTPLYAQMAWSDTQPGCARVYAVNEDLHAMGVHQSHPMLLWTNKELISPAWN